MKPCPGQCSEDRSSFRSPNEDDFHRSSPLACVIHIIVELANNSQVNDETKGLTPQWTKSLKLKSSHSSVTVGD